jgi:hypothetical protein
MTGNLAGADADLWALVDAWLEGTATPAQKQQLEIRLAKEHQARLFYVAYLDLHAQLQWRTRGESRRERDRDPGSNMRRRPSRARWIRITLACSALAAMVMLVAWLLLKQPDQEETVDAALPAGCVAVLIDSRNTVWEDDMSLPREAGSALPPGRLKLRSGVVEVAFNGGGEVLLEGPADFDVAAADKAVLHRGKLTARVADGVAPFRVSTPGVVVTDRGGECGLLQEDGCTEIHVFGGQVAAEAADVKGGLPEKRLLPNTGTRVDPGRQILTEVPLNEEAFAALRPAIRATGATVRDGVYADTNYATASFLMVKNSIPGYSWESFLHFDLSGVKGKINKAFVRLTPVKLGQQLTNAVAFVPDNRWAETTITWNSKPVSGEAFAVWTAELEKAVEFDVTPYVQDALAGDKRLSLRIFAPQVTRGNSYVQYGSRKGGFEARPELSLIMAR